MILLCQNSHNSDTIFFHIDPTFYLFMIERRMPVAVLDTCEIVSIIYLQKKMLQNWKSIFIAVCGSRIFPTLLNAVT